MPIVALISDLGYEDAGVAVAKGILMRSLPISQIVDITHDIRPYHALQAGYILLNCYKKFQPGTIFIAVTDVFYSTSAQLILVEQDGYYFLSPNNGLLSQIIATSSNAQLVQVFDSHQRLDNWIIACESVVKQIVNGLFESNNFPLITPVIKKEQHLIDENGIRCDVLYIDIYENVVLNFTREDYEKYKKSDYFKLSFIQYESIDQLSVNYVDVKKGKKLCRFNNNGFLEIAVNNGRAASLFGLKYGSPHNKIYLNFDDSKDSQDDFHA